MRFYRGLVIGLAISAALWNAIAWVMSATVCGDDTACHVAIEAGGPIARSGE